MMNLSIPMNEVGGGVEIWNMAINEGSEGDIWRVIGDGG